MTRATTAAQEGREACCFKRMTAARRVWHQSTVTSAQLWTNNRRSPAPARRNKARTTSRRPGATLQAASVHTRDERESPSMKMQPAFSRPRICFGSLGIAATSDGTRFGSSADGSIVLRVRPWRTYSKPDVQAITSAFAESTRVCTCGSCFGSEGSLIEPQVSPGVLARLGSNRNRRVGERGAKLHPVLWLSRKDGTDSHRCLNA